MDDFSVRNIIEQWCSSWPQPAECPCGEQTIDQTIEHVLRSVARRLATPDRVCDVAQTVSHEGCCARYSKDLEIIRSRRQSMPNQVRDEEADHQAEEKPASEVLAHVHRTAWHYREYANRALAEFRLDLRLLLLLWSTDEREHVDSARDASVAQGSEYCLLLWDLAIVAAVIAQDHVQNGTSHENDNRSQQNRKPQSCQWNHGWSPPLQFLQNLSET